MGGDSFQGISLSKASTYVRSTLKIRVSDSAKLTEPYFIRFSVEEPFYILQDYELRNAPTTPYAFLATASLTYHGAQLDLSVPVGQALDKPVSITPRISVSVLPSVRLLYGGNRITTIEAEIRSSGIEGGPATVLVQSPDYWIATPHKQELETLPGDYREEFRISAPLENHDLRILEPIVETPAGSYTRGFRRVGYPGIPTTNYYTPATVRIVPVDLNLPPPIASPTCPAPATPSPRRSPPSTSNHAEILAVADLTPAKLAPYDTVILGVRTYNAHPDLHGAAHTGPHRLRPQRRQRPRAVPDR